MITYLTREEVKIEKYNACISKSRNSRIYAFSWYLDIVADNWDILVFGNYEAVMPLPWRNKYFVKYIYLPAWTQQLGVFSPEDVSEELIHLFLKSLPKKFKLVETYLNSKNRVENTYLKTRVNYILNLNKPYHQLFDEFKKGRKSDLRSAKRHDILIREVDNAEQLIELFKFQKEEDVPLKEADYSRLERLSKELILLKKALTLEMYNSEKILLGGVIFLIDSKRITYLFSVSNSEGRQKKVTSVAIDWIIKKYSNSTITLDFEGSMIPNLASYFRSFGAAKEEYYHYKKYNFWS